MTAPEGLTREERAEYWRQRRLKLFEGDAEMQGAIRTTKFDFEVPEEYTPEETAEDIRIARERRNSPTISLDEFFQWLDEECPDEAEYTLPDPWSTASA